MVYSYLMADDNPSPASINELINLLRGLYHDLEEERNCKILDPAGLVEVAGLLSRAGDSIDKAGTTTGWAPALKLLDDAINYMEKGQERMEELCIQTIHHYVSLTDYSRSKYFSSLASCSSVWNER
jgi:hypothetical protein